MQYKITITELKEYPEMQTVYEGDDGKRYFSTYRMPDNLKYTTKDLPTGKQLVREREVYQQDFEATDLTDIIKAVNKI